jgi:DNA polymerase III alpha subunit (gram-positive type)
LSTLLFVDVETTGLDDNRFDPIEIAGIIVRGDTVINEFEYQMRPVKVNVKKIKFYNESKRVFEFNETDLVKVLLGTGDVVRMVAGDLKNLKKFKITFGNNYSQEMIGEYTKTVVKKEWAEAEEGALRAHGIPWSQIKEFPDPLGVYKKIMTFIKENREEGEKVFLAGHNADFDKGFIFKWASRMGIFEHETYIDKYTTVCTLEMAKNLKARGLLSCKRINLKALCKHFNIPLVGAHRAINDIRATVAVYHKLIELFKLDNLHHQAGIQASLFDSQSL